MHAVHLPPRDLWRSAALAALLALACMALLLMTAGRLSSDGAAQPSLPQTQVAVPHATPPAAQPTDVSTWLKPLATPEPLLKASQTQ